MEPAGLAQPVDHRVERDRVRRDLSPKDPVFEDGFGEAEVLGLDEGGEEGVEGEAGESVAMVAGAEEGIGGGGGGGGGGIEEGEDEDVGDDGLGGAGEGGGGERVKERGD